MKNYIFILLLFTLTALSAQNDSILDITETERIIDKYGDKIITGFEKAVSEITPVAEQGFEIVVKLQIAKGIFSLIIFLSSLLLLILHIKFIKIIYDKNNILLGIFVPVIHLFYLIWSIIEFKNAIMYLMAPEWFAIKEIMGLF